MSFTETSGVRLCWDEAGQGQPLLLIMGATFSRQMWQRAIPALSERYRVIRYDNRGIGESQSVAGPFTIADMARDAEAVMDAAGASTAHVYGVSMGGLVAQELALTRPQRVRSLALGCTWAASPDKRRPAWTTDLRYLIPQRLLLRMSVPMLYGPNKSKALVREDLAILRRERMDRACLRAQAHAVFGYESRSRLAGITAPALVLHGERDRIVPVAWGRELAQTLPDARLVMLPGAGHNYLTDSTRQSNDALLTFLSEVDRQAVAAASDHRETQP